MRSRINDGTAIRTKGDDMEMGFTTVRPMEGSPSSSQENILLKEDKVFVQTSYRVTTDDRDDDVQMGGYNSIGVPR